MAFYGLPFCFLKWGSWETCLRFLGEHWHADSWFRHYTWWVSLRGEEGRRGGTQESKIENSFQMFLFFFLALSGLSGGMWNLHTCTQASLRYSMWHAGLVALPACGNLSSLSRDGSHILCIRKWIIYHWTTRESPSDDFFYIYQNYNYCLIKFSHVTFFVSFKKPLCNNR